MKRCLLLGGYGNFGKRLAEGLRDLPDLTLVIAGRNPDKAGATAERLRAGAGARLESLRLDTGSERFEHELAEVGADLVINTAGPFQGQAYGVPEACIRSGAHYLDLADDRHFVCGLTRLDDAARAAGVCLVSGASSVPGLSSAVVDHYRERFGDLDAIDIAIAPGNRAERGLATVRGILSYTGHPFRVFRDGRWRDVHGWMTPRYRDFGRLLGKRWLANVDVPDLALFPDRYHVSDRVSFQAGLELGLLHWAMVSMAGLTRLGLVRNWAPLASPIFKLSHAFQGFGTDDGGMMVELNGRTAAGEPLGIRWRLVARAGVGPYIPTLSALILARRWLSDTSPTPGAWPCLGLFSLQEFKAHADRLGLIIEEEVHG